MDRTTGAYQRVIIAGQAVQAFIPTSLPPKTPALSLDGAIAERLHQAEQALARLNVAGELVPSLDWFIYAFVRKEAVISSQIESTQTTLLDLLAFEAEDNPLPNPDVEEVSNYLLALNYARAELGSAHGLPVSIRLLNEAHKRLMRGERGARALPGQIRKSQNWIGGNRPSDAIYIPPPPEKLPQLLADLEDYIHSEDRLPELVRAGLIHVQFESIHPYLDGNGRIGRLLIAMLLEHWGLLRSPLLYLSLFFKQRRDEYYRRLNAVRLHGDFEGWIAFLLEGVTAIADEAISSARELFALVSADRERILSISHPLGSHRLRDSTSNRREARVSVSAVRLFELLPRHPIVSVGLAMKLLDTTKPTAAQAIKALEAAGILVETTGRRRDRSFAYQRYLERLRVGTELSDR
jgi:Fic family protein